MIKIGQGIDVHAFCDNGRQPQYVVLAGVRIEHSHSLLAHSDGDVVLHALADALLEERWHLVILVSTFLILMLHIKVWIREFCCVMCMTRYKKQGTCSIMLILQLCVSVLK